MEWLMTLAVFWLICGAFGGYIAGAKRRPAAEGFAFGVLLGPVGLLLLALLPTGDVRPKVARPELAAGPLLPATTRGRVASAVAAVLMGAVIVGAFAYASRLDGRTVARPQPSAPSVP